MMDLSKMQSVVMDGVSLKQMYINGTQVWGKTEGLPATFQQVAYLETDGDQYIKTGVLASGYPEGISYSFKGRVKQVAYANNQTSLWGAEADGVNAGNAVMYWNAGQWRFYVGSGQGGYFVRSTLIYPNRDFEMAATAVSNAPQRARVTVDGASLNPGGTALVAADMPNAEIYLLHCNGSSRLKFCGQLQAFAMHTPEGTPIRQFIPCYRKTDGVIGLYDTVSKRFFENAGTGTFTKGADV